MDFWNNKVGVSKEAAEMQISIIKTFSSDKRMRIALDFANLSIGQTREWIKNSNPNFSELEITLEFVRLMYYETGKMVGMKPAGGISNAKLALQYLVMVKETLGNDWLNPSLFRFGASSLANDVLMQWVKEKTGRYQSLNYFSND